ncbi:MAG TPA: hypothetical protein PKZ32_12985 [Candidatus Melainabacteria bacterium]|nr:hypothetical protein [Candidatus Melainabacteria bacterium]
MNNLFKKIRSIWGKKETPAAPEEDADELCCEGKVHIAYRGISDDKMYVSYNRRWDEVKFFKPNGLRVFCSGCRRRLL